MSTGGRTVSCQDLQRVQNLIEWCLQLYMNEKEVTETLLDRAKIDPTFTKLVWQKLEEQNQEFFKAYYLRLMVKHQIIEFNKLLEQQVELMRQMHSTGMASMSTSNGSHIPAVQRSAACHQRDSTEPALKQENIHHTLVSSLPNVFPNGSSTPQSGMHNGTEMPSHTGRIDLPAALLSTQNSNAGMMQGMIGGMIKSEPGYSGSSPYMLGADGNILEPRQIILDAPVGSYGSVESSSQSLNESLLDADISSFGFLGRIPRNFSLSDLTAECPNSTDIFLSYPRSPFLAVNDSFLDPHDQDHQDSKGLETISEGLSYEGFKSD